MKKIFLLVLGIIPALTSFGQNYAQINAIGHYDYSIWPSPPGTVHKGFVTIETLKDTIISGKNSQVLRETIHTPNGVRTGEYYYIHSTDSLVYDFDPNNNFSMGILYDYSLGIGDSLILGNHPITIHIDSVYSTNVNGVSRTVQETSQRTLGLFFEGKNVQGIGNLYYFFPIFDGDFKGGLRCYQDSVIGYYHNPRSDSCTAIITSLKELSSSDKMLEFFPNPAKQKLWLKNSKSLSSSRIDYIIYDSKGAVIKEKIQFAINEPINIEQLKKGIYFISIRTEKGHSWGKFVKQ